MKQRAAEGAMLGQGNWWLIPPGSDEFTLYGGADVVRQAQEWAFEQEVLLYRGPAEHCVHGLYRMDTCTFTACTSVGLDHTQIWVHRDGSGAFLLTHPYAADIPDTVRMYAEMHGLKVSSSPLDHWYRETALPIRLAVPDNWPLWPIERDAAVLLHTQPITWPGDD